MAAPRSKGSTKTEDPTEDAGSDTASDTAAPEATDSKRAGRPTYDLKPVGVGDLPEKAPSRRALVYFDLLTTVMNDFGEDNLVEIAQFKSDTGAGMTATSLRKGERKVPGEVDDWTFVAAKVDTDEGRQSRLYAGYKLSDATLESIKAAGYRVTGNETEDEDEDEA